MVDGLGFCRGWRRFTRNSCVVVVGSSIQAFSTFLQKKPCWKPPNQACRTDGRRPGSTHFGLAWIKVAIYAWPEKCKWFRKFRKGMLNSQAFRGNILRLFIKQTATQPTLNAFLARRQQSQRAPDGRALKVERA